MKYIYGDFSKKQIKEAARAMHNDIHKLLLYKDKNVKEFIFEDDDAFISFFNGVMLKFGGTKTLFNDNGYMVELMSTLQAAYDEVMSDNFDYLLFRKAILDSHAYIKLMFERSSADAESINS